MERILLIKSIILPQFLFLFQTLPIYISLPVLNKWQRMLTDFIWDHGSHTVSMSVLSRPAKLEGFGLPLLRSYYAAAQLRALYTYLQGSVDRDWTHIEESYVTPHHLRKLIWNKPFDRPKSWVDNPFLNLTLTVWDKYRSSIMSNISLQSSFLGQKWFPPAHNPDTFQVWCKGNIYKLCDISSKGLLLAKEELEQRFQVTIPWLQYYQVHHIYKSLVKNTEASEKGTEFELKLALGDLYIKGLISLLYVSLNGTYWNSPPSFQNWWVRQCNIDPSTDVWSRIWSSSLLRSRSTYVRMQHFKVLTKWYFTPVRIRRIDPTLSPVCWKGYSQSSDYWHCWWECRQMQIFWKAVVYHISKISSHDIPLTPEVILLDLWPNSNIPISSRNLISLLLLAVKCVVAQKWKQPRSTIKDWYIKIWDLMIADKMLEGILLREQKTEG